MNMKLLQSQPVFNTLIVDGVVLSHIQMESVVSNAPCVMFGIDNDY